MKRFSEQLQKKSASIRLRADEKLELRERVVSYMEYHPLPVVQSTTKEKAKPKSIVTPAEDVLFKISGWRFLQVTGMAFGIFLISASYFAERAIPGDSLYAVKIQFNEEVRSTLARSPYEKVVWETERMSRRISEARLLASEGKLTEAVENEVANAVREHSANAQREIEILKQTDKEEAVLASLQLSTAIDVQSTTLRKDQEATSGEGQSTNQIATVLAETESQISDVTTKPETLPSYERLIAHLEQETTRAYELLQSVETVATKDELADIRRRLQDIERTSAGAMSTAGADDVVAREQLMIALENNQKLIVFMSNIDVKNAVTVEEIVPIIPTDDELRAYITETASQTEARLMAAELAMGSSTEPIADKVLPALEGSRATVQEVIDGLLQPGADLQALSQLIKDASAIANDIALLLNLEDTEQPVVISADPIVEEEQVLEGEESLIESTTATSTATGTSPIIGEEVTPEPELPISN